MAEFHDITFREYDYKPFNAADWPPHESGPLASGESQSRAGARASEAILQRV
jgi:hypothetical protein